MTRDEMIEVLKFRREVTGENFNTGTVNAWQRILGEFTDTQVCDAVQRAVVTRAALGHDTRVAPAHVITELPHVHDMADTAHPTSCICSGHGWVEVEQHDERHTWWAWDRCPDGPPTGYTQPTDDGPLMSYDEYVQRAANRPVTFDALDHDWARRAARAIVTDPDAVPVSAVNPLRALVDRYVREQTAR